MSPDFSLANVNSPSDWNNLPDMAKKHVPRIEAPSSASPNTPIPVKIKVGGIDGIEHPNMLGHWINWVELYAGERLIHRTELAPEMTNGYVITIHVTLQESTQLRAKSSCNLHGVWEAQPQTISVK